LLDLDWYRARYGLRATAGEALLHYFWLGDLLGLKPHPWFDASSARESAVGSGGKLTPVLSHYMASWMNFPVPHPLFDQRYYLEENLDVRVGGHNPLVHFVLHGQKEGRRPNAYFDPDWYREANPDVANLGIVPALHFVTFGAAEGRNPGPNFDSVSYRLQVGDAGLGSMDPLSHYLTIGRKAGIHPKIRALSVQQLVDTKLGRCLDKGCTMPVDVVVPVYRGLEETRACIESLLAASKENYLRLHIYNDASPEPAITGYLRHVAATASVASYVENEANLGFVGTVNRAMRTIMQQSDFDSVILLNSDTEVSGDWAKRLRNHARSDGLVATVTALSNNATICSYPLFGGNVLPDDETPASIDALASVVNCGESVEVPTGVGFCMLITRAGLERIGLFDEEAFGKGYGEEVDFCQKAIRAGMRNLLALDVYVKHAGEVSFTTSSKPSKLLAEEIIKSRYPEYQPAVATFVRSDPALHARLRLTFSRWRQSRRDVHVFFTHALGGGTERHVREVIDRLPLSSRAVIVRPAKAHSQRLMFECLDAREGFSSEIEVVQGADLAAILVAMGTQRIQIHHSLGFSRTLRDGLALSGIPFDFIVHDYFTACPQITMTNADGAYCGERGLSHCDECIVRRPSHGARDIRNWRIANEWLVLGADTIVAPSKDSAERIDRYFQRSPEVRPHEDHQILTPASPKRRRNRRPRVLILGALAPHKGRRQVFKAVEEAINGSLPIEFHLIGDPQGDVPKQLMPAFTWSGCYSEDELDTKIQQAQGDVVLFASQAPETYSYTLSAAIRSGLPIVATELGAFVERLAGHPAARIVPPDIPPSDLLQILMIMAEPIYEAEST
jgi:GT2 family glycosyltransferase/glycosyltransferase involved in cell wall biosynthesis